MNKSKRRLPSFLPVNLFYHLTNDGALAAISASYPILITVEELGLNYEYIGILTSLGLAITIVCQILTGVASEKRDPQPLLAVGFIILGIGLLVLTRVNSFLTLLTVSLIIRAGASFYHPVCIAWISKKFAHQDLDRAMGTQSSTGDFGVLLALATTGVLAINFGWRVPFLIWGILNIVAVVIGVATKYDTKIPRTRDGDKIIEKEGRASIGKMFKYFRFSLLPLALMGAAYTITINFGPLLVKDKLLGAADVAGWTVALWIGAGAISAYLYDRIARVAGRERLMVICFVLVSIISLLVGLAAELYQLMVLMIFFGFFLFLTWPGLFSMISDATGKLTQGPIFSIIFAFQISGGAIIAYIAGLVAQLYGIDKPFFLLSVILLLPLVTFSLHIRKNEKE
jgi:MFS family permease